MTELTGKGAITDEYLAEAEVLSPIQENKKLKTRERLKLQDAGLKALMNNQKPVS